MLPARCQPKFMVLVAGREDTQRAKRLIMTLAKSVRRWAASVRMARLCARYPPALTEKGKEDRGEIFPAQKIPTPHRKGEEIKGRPPPGPDHPKPKRGALPAPSLRPFHR